MVEDSSVVTTEVMTEGTIEEEIAVAIGIALSARTTTSHFVTSATVAKQIVRAEVALVVEATEVAHATVETAEVRDPQIHAMVAAEEELLEAAADRADQDSEAQVVAASVATDRAEAAVDVESAPPQHSSRLLVSSAYGAKRGDALDRCA